MARVRDIGIDEVPEDATPIYQRFADEYGPFLNQVKVFMIIRMVQEIKK